MPNPVPAGYATVTPYLCVSDPAKLIEFLQKTFDAQLLFKMDGPGGRSGTTSAAPRPTSPTTFGVSARRTPTWPEKTK